jgi:hypothetical protein
MINLQLSVDEATFLSAQLRRQLQTVENELIHTDVHKMQHELSLDLSRLREIDESLAHAIASHAPPARATH